jgi:hypothetical protein
MFLNYGRHDTSIPQLKVLEHEKAAISAEKE